MASTALHEELPALSLEVLSPDPAAFAAVEAHAAAGCSPCARALFNARDATVTLAESAAPLAPRVSLRERLLSTTRVGVTARAATSAPRPARRFFDPAGELARLHAGTPEDCARTREVDDLGVASPPVDDVCGRLLAQIQGLLGFPLLFVSVIRGDRCGYRAQLGLGALSSLGPRDRRRETTFCTHTVSTGGPMVVPDAAREPFFRGSPMVLRDGIRAYVGVPLVTSRGIAIGSVCAMDSVPRRIGPEVVRTLERYAEPLVAEIERARRCGSGGS